MRRYLQLYLYFLRFSFSKAFEFRVDYYFRVVMDLFYYAVNIAFYGVLYEHTRLLAGWDRSEIMVFVGAYLVVDALVMSFFANNLWWLPILVNRGDVDYYLTRPVSTLFFLALREFAANSCLNLLMASAVLLWALDGLGKPLDLIQLLVFGVLLVNGAVLYALTNLLLVLPVFWIHSANGLRNVFYLLTRTMERPDRIFNGWVRRVLVSVLPFGVMASFPARTILDGLGPGLLLHTAAVTVLISALVALVWRLALRAYSSASS